MKDDTARLIAWGNYEAALRTLKDAGAGKFDGLEQKYGLAALRLIRMGEMAPLRRKYRTK